MTEAAPKPSIFNLSALRAGLKKYGRTGVFVYLGLSSCVTASFYLAIEQHVDVKKILHTLGMKEEEQEEGREPGFMEKIVVGKGSNLALAILCSKAMVPIKLPIAVAITPYVHRWREQFFKTAVAASKP